MKEGYAVIDADGHVQESEDELRRFLDDRYRNRKMPGFSMLPMDGVDRSVGGKYGKYHHDPTIQIQDMDIEGIDIQVLYGTLVLAMTPIKDREWSVALHGAFNDFLAEFCSHNPNRLKGIAALPTLDPVAAARELERCVTQYGFIGAMAHTWNYNHNIDDEYYDELYACAQQHNVPIAFHAAGNEIPRFDTFLAEHTLGHTHEQMCAALFAIFGGIPEKFPHLTMAFLEGMCGWIPMLAERMDEEYEKRPFEAPLLTKRPSAYFKSDRIFFGIEPEEWMIPHVIQFLGTDRNLVYASDYPHWDGAFPNSTRGLVERTDLTEGNKRNILGENARRLYPALTKVPVPA